MTIEKKTTDVSVPKSDSKRSLLKKAAIGVPTVVALTSKPAFGAVCSLSGFQSVNPSGVERHGGCEGFSPGAWKENGYKTGNMDGSREQWLAAGCCPNPRVHASIGYKKSRQYPQDLPGTLFYEVFPNSSPSRTIASDETLHDVLLRNPGSLEFHTISNFLNANYFRWGEGEYMNRISAFDIRGIYLAYTGMESTYITEAGNVVNLDILDLQGFFAQLYH